MLNQRQTTKDLIEKYNKPRPLEAYLLPFVGDKKEVKIADIGSGPYSIIGSHQEGIDVKIYHSDKKDFSGFWNYNKAKPVITVEYQDMEKLRYPSEFFDIIHCVNALDHTFGALRALKEMIRVCKRDGFVYIDCALNQLNTGHKHYWNAKTDGSFHNYYETFNLKDFGFEVTFIDNGGESRYNHIVAILQKHD